MKKIIRNMIGIMVLMSSISTWGRWAEVSEADGAVNFEKNYFTVRKDGSYVVEVEYQVEILKESARQRWGLTRLTFDSRASKFNLVDAYTINGDQRVKVRSEHIEIKPMASSGPGFDEISQVTIAFPEVQVGSKLFYRYRREVLKPQIPGVFWLHYPVGWGDYVQKLEVHLESEVPLYIETFDPENKVKVSSKGEKSFSLELTSPTYRQVVEEDNSKMNAKSLIWVGISSMKDWSFLPLETLQAYEKVAATELPTKFKQIVEAAKKEKTEVDQINVVTSKLSDAIRYVGDWAPVEGAFYPRGLSLVIETGFGDCKDFSTSTVAMLRHLGFEAHAAWVVRDRNLVSSPIELPGPYFNHAIVYARKGGKEYWIDPTNVSSFAQGIYEDIANRRSIVLFSQKPERKMIPPATEKDSNLRLDIQVAFKRDQVAESKGRIQIHGGDIIGFTGAQMTFSKSALDFYFLSWISNPAMLREWSFSDYDLTSRIVKDFSADFTFSENWSAVPTSAGKGYMMKPPAHLDPFIFREEKRVSDLQLGNPRTMHRQYTFAGGKAILKNGRVRCNGDSPWLKYDREFRRKGSDVILQEEVTLKKSSVSNAEIHGKEFKNLQKALLQCQQPAVLVLQ